MLIPLLLLLVSQKGEYADASTRHTALSPIPGQTPPPEDALAWVEEVKKGWVMVWDLGDGERWVRALHPRAATSVKLWRHPNVESKTTKAPYWIEEAPAYVLAAVWNTIKYIVMLPKTFNPQESELKKSPFYERIYIDSTARTVVSVHKTETDMSEYLELFLRLVWKMHSTFFVMLVYERYGDYGRANESAISWSPDLSQSSTLHRHQVIDQWQRFYFDPFKGKNGSLLPLPANMKARELTAVIGRLFYDLRQHPLNILASYSHDPRVSLYSTSCVKEKYRGGSDLQAIFEVTRTMNSRVSFGTTAGNYTKLKLKYNLVSMLKRAADMWALRLGIGIPLPYIESTWRDDGFYFFVPRPEPLPAWSLPLRGLGGNIWRLVAASMVLFAITWHVLTGKPFSSCITDTLAVFSTYGTPDEMITSRRLHLAGTMLVSSLVIVILYQGRLFAITTEAEYEKPIITLHDLADSGLPVIAGHHRSLEALGAWAQNAPEEDAPAAKAIWKRGRIGEVGYSQMRHVEIWGGGYIFSHHIWDSSLVCMRSTKLPDANSIHVSVNWPWRGTFSKRFRWTFESGFYDKWMEDSYKYLAAERKQQNRSLLEINSPNTHARIFALSDLWPHFQILLVGHIFSTVAFALELWKKGLRRRR